MANILDYIDWRGDLAFRERPFNDVDNLILSTLAYTDFSGIAGAPGEDKSISLTEAYRQYRELGRDQSDMPCNPMPLLEKCSGTRRFGRMLVESYVDETDEEKQMQFAAVTFVTDDKKAYTAFRGTDNTFTGWREDLNFSFMTATPAQLEAVRYLNGELERRDCGIRVGGHSKGGNLAIFAAAFCPPEYRKRILRVYSNDGPGFNRPITASEGYRKMLLKIRLIIPEGSVVGLLLSNKKEKIIVESSVRGVKQHLPYHWEVRRDGFVTAVKQTSASLLLDRTMDGWLDSMDSAERQAFVSAVFDSLEASGLKTITEMNQDPLTTVRALRKASAALSSQSRGSIVNAMKKFAEALGGTLKEEASKGLKKE